MRIYPIDGQEKPRWYGDEPELQRAKRLDETQEIVLSRCAPIRAEDSSDDDRGTYMLVMVLGWLVYFLIGFLIGRWTA